jgi:hypothetical protein
MRQLTMAASGGGGLAVSGRCCVGKKKEKKCASELSRDVRGWSCVGGVRDTYVGYGGTAATSAARTPATQLSVVDGAAPQLPPACGGGSCGAVPAPTHAGRRGGGSGYAVVSRPLNVE